MAEMKKETEEALVKALQECASLMVIHQPPDAGTDWLLAVRAAGVALAEYFQEKTP